ncbi:MAG TPA: fatty acid desaturase, partial [Polyangiaceae bacterium]|nr:fatty acid desaturase [Polyangiaceae bacterium]
HLTCPERDPESMFCTREAWERMGRFERAFFRAQTTALGRLAAGPLVVVARFAKQELAAVVRGAPGRRRVWALHAVAVSLVLVWVLGVAAMPLWKYLAAFVYPGTALTLLRSLAEHRADVERERRTTVVEAGWLFRLLFLNNNFHVMHHRAPHVPWFDLPELWQRERVQILRDRSHVVYSKGYLAIVRAHATKSILS